MNNLKHLVTFVVALFTWAVADAQNGCTNPGACNFDPFATVDDGSCLWSIDCAGNCGGTFVVDACENCYDPNISGEELFQYSGSIQYWVVPDDISQITIEAFGGQGGSGNGGAGGLGARIRSTVSVTPGETLSILVGGQGQSQSTRPAGGGGSFIVRSDNSPLVVAGGGGAVINSPNGNEHGQITENGANGFSPCCSSNYGLGGIDGNGATNFSGGPCAGNGGGFLSDGQISNCIGANARGRGFLNGGSGGVGGCGGELGGFGGGGGGGCDGAGGGGGYSGGGASYSNGGYGGGGGSFAASAMDIAESGVQSGNGLVIITYSTTPLCIPGCTDPEGDQYDPLANYDNGSCTYDLGCIDPTACNYDMVATIDDGTCEYIIDCAGTCGGTFFLDACGNCYDPNVENDVNFAFSGTIETWTVPADGMYIIEAAGAEGGTVDANNIGGLGARMKGEFFLTAGTQLNILVGQKGFAPSNISNEGGGGGGGTFVTFGADYQSSTPLIVAGGGGGGTASYQGVNQPGQGGQTTNNGPVGGDTGDYCDNGGAGFSGNSTCAGNARSFTNGGAGGNSNYSGHGGFGGGGASIHHPGGGGGGYSGGRGGYNFSTTARGGGSYNDGANQDNLAATNIGDGYVIIQYNNIPVCIEGCTDPLACNFNPDAQADDNSCILPDGCIDPAACNYDVNALCDNGTCTYPGCIDAGACNFDPNAACDDGSCIFFVDCAGTCGGTFILDECNNCFDPEGAESLEFNYSGNIQQWTVPEGVTEITIEVFGAQGGGGGGFNSLPGGRGARMKGTLAVTPGQVLDILVGQQGGTGGSSYDPHGNENGGGGGSFVVLNGDNTPLIIAGGGGGGPATSYGNSCSRDISFGHGKVTENGGDTQNCNGIGYGGTSGNGGTRTGSYSGGAGGGFFSNGQNGQAHCSTPFGGSSYLNGGAGGNASSCYSSNVPRGGFGGGGAGELGSPGGGGGYSGGGASGSWSSFSTYGGGGGSYNIGTNQDNESGAREGNGLVIISYPLIPNCSLGCTDPMADNFDPAATDDDGSCRYDLGCLDTNACNFDETATEDDGSCLYLDCAGVCGGTFITDACGNCFEGGGELQTLNFDYTGDVQVFTAPTTGDYTFETWGAQAGNITSLYPINGGLGGYAKGTMSLTAGETVYIYVGGKGEDRSGDHPYGSCAFVAGGWNGGGATRTAGNGTPGGGASDIRIGGQDLSNRVIVAGGGGGGGWTYARGGAGGGLQGENGTQSNQSGTGAQGGTQVAGGSQGTTGGSCGVSSGSFGQGGDGSGSSAGGGGGGGGWYGGGGGGYADGGGGGSSYVGNLANTELMTGVREGNGLVAITFSNVPECIAGCMDMAACNFNPDAGVDDGSCFYPDGCIDPLACNYDANALCDNGTCTYPGCVDAGACNYDPNAACDDGSCIFVVDCAGLCGGPYILDDCENCYDPAQMVEAFEFNYTGSLQTWTVPEGVTEIDIEVLGAQGGGGGYNSLPGGLGARMKGTFSVTPGQSFDILVGQKGQTGAETSDPHGNENGGGGGSFVVLNGPNTPYIIAGGGGGGPSSQYGFNCSRDVALAHGQITENGATISCWSTGNGGSNGQGGTTGGSYQGGAGGGFNGNGSSGGSHCCTSAGGASYVNGAAGGNGNCCYGSNNRGGYGGGGGGQLGGPGGGGGYSGGGTAANWDTYSTYGGGGGSYNMGTNQDNLAGVQEGDGLVIISYSTIPVCIPGCTDAGADNFDAEANYDDGSCRYDLGCTDVAACNFDPTANEDDGSCAYVIDCAGTCGGNFVLDACGNCYEGGVSGEASFSYTGSIENWIVPEGVTEITIDAYGAQGGTGNGGQGGRGARIQGSVSVTPGQTLQILVGGSGQNSSTRPGGGGGSFVATADNTPLLVAGGGGGVINSANGNEHGLTVENGNNGFSPCCGSNYGQGGTGGNGATNFSGGPCAGNGGGFFSDGQEPSCASGNTRGKGFVNGGQGGVGSCGGELGGFGGGGGGGCDGAGGGGGYSGGGASYADGGYGGGGGSYVAGSTLIAESGVQTGNGSIIITYGGAPSCIEGCTDPTACNYDANADLDNGSCILPDGNIYLECPDNISVMGEEGQTGVVVNYDMPLLFGICDEFSNGAGLADLPAVFSANYATLLSQLGSTYNFSYDGGANAISDGGGDMYDGGNYLNTNYSSNFNYTSGSVVQGGQFGPSGAYFTQQLPGMFILAADMDNVSHFEITGNLGADGSGSVTAYSITSGDYTGFYKRVCSAGDPSVNQLMIVETSAGASQTWPGSTDNNQHRVENINSASRIYYLLWSGQSGFCYDEPAVQSLMNNFLDLLPQGNPSLIAGETSGSEFPAGTTTVTWQFEASDGNFYDCSFDVTVEIPGWGCTDPTACNFDPAAQFDNGSCIGGGCLDEQACNYDPNAPCDNGSCIFIVDCAGICGGSYVLDDCGNCYDSEGVAEAQFDYSGNIQQWIVPEGVTEVTIEVFGAQGGGGGGFNSLPGGLGARMKGTFAVTPGQTLDILVGEKGGTGGSSYDPHGNENGGGGGSFVVLNGDNTPLIIAGGGGGGPATSYGNSCSRDISFAHGKVTENGGDTQNCNGIGYGGTSGNGGSRTGSNSGAAGGGFFTDGQNGQAHCSTPFGGQSYLNGGAGGNANSCYSSNVPRGGFGGGGAGELGSPGGGGGYSGGGAAGSWSSFSTYGGGGGSYNIGLDQDNESGAREGNGVVIITYPIAPDCAPGCTDPLADNYDAAANFDDGSCRYDLGCMDANACNYDETAAEDDGSCLYLDCEGVCGGDSVLDACGNCYSSGGVTGEVVFDYSGSIVTWTVPAGVTEISIEAFGAQGGNGQGIGGLGARMRGTVAVTPGDDLKILVGQRPSGNGGGGGSFVATSIDEPLVVAGGGGGGAGNCCGTVHDGGPGLTTEQGGNGINNSGTIGAGGSGGNGGNVYSSSSSAGGGGFYSNGQTASSSNSQGGFAFVNGGSGGTTQNVGGFGGGGSSLCQGTPPSGCAGGGGGGYSGGGGSEGGSQWGAGGGGGSFVAGVIEIAESGVNAGNGQIIIYYDATPVCVEDCTDPAACNFNPEADIDNGSCFYPDGCIDPTACNYDANALCDNGTCTYPGCVDAGACNFDPNAACDDGSCIFFVDCAGTCGGTFIEDACGNCFDQNSMAEETFTYTGSLQNWTVPEGVTSITIEVFGAQGGGGGYNSLPGGLGARMKGTFNVVPGESFNILVGEKGLTGADVSDPQGHENGGGGGSFVVRTDNTPYIIAGGGGGGPSTDYGFNCSRDVNLAHGQITESGSSISCYYGVSGGSGGNGGGAVGYMTGGAGGGFFSNGSNGGSHCCTSIGGQAYLNGAAGGSGNCCYGSNNRGGYGGGGGGQLGGPGGGGGYSGGATAADWSSWGTYGGGGGSYNIGTDQDNLSGAQEGNGLVIITYDLTPVCVEGCIDPAACNFDPEADVDNGSCFYPDGCIDPTACNYDANALCDNGTCTYPGCTDLGACNFDPNAACEDGSCIFYVDCAGTCGGTFIEDACGNCYEAGGGLETLTLDFTGDVQVFTAPTTGEYTFETWGAQAGNITSLYPINGGLGGYAKGTMSLTAGETVYIYVGGKGQDRSGDHPYGSCAFVAGGWNGGGATRTAGNGTPGGGASDIRIGGQDLSNRVIVAGGGGGGGWTYARGGAGGGLQGENGTREYQSGTGAQGGTQVSGGSQGTTGGGCGVSSGSFGQGGDGSGSSAGGGGGGGGWYGGGGGGYADGGGGGSSYVGNLVNTEMLTGVREGNGQVVITFSSIPECIEDCTDPAACNFNPDAQVENGSCFYPDGCIDPTACNYDENALCDNGTCTYPGCNDEAACNFDPNAACNDGSCIFFVDCAGNCGGPFILDDCENCYNPADQVESFEFNYTGNIQQWIVPEGVTEITIEVRGAQGGGGGYNSLPGGLGARMAGTFAVTPGETFDILVGQKGQTGADVSDPHGNENGGGGGSFVVLNGPNTPYIVAGGGGGGPSTTNSLGCPRDITIGHGQITEQGATVTCNWTAIGGSNGNGGSTAGGSEHGGAGAGFFGNGSNGGTHCCTGIGGTSYLNGAAGGSGNCCYGSNNRGGYGGGGGGNLGGPGGGGGYSGGAAAGGWSSFATYGGGGGSYNIGTNQDNLAGVQEGNGLVIISYQTIPLCVPGCDDPMADNYDPEVNYNNGSCIYLGCIDPAACNFDSEANTDDGSCIYIIDCAGVCGGSSIVDDCGNCYDPTQAGQSYIFPYTGFLQTFVVPDGVAQIYVEAFGASGGSWNGEVGGLGAKVAGMLEVQPGQQMKLLVGGAGQNGDGQFRYAGGGGGSFVTDNANNPILIAGGGGGVSGGPTNANMHASTGEMGNDGYSPNGLLFYGVGGSAGNGATNAATGEACGGNGGGLLTNGEEALCANQGTETSGLAFVNGGDGGVSACGAGIAGGYGGGGGGGCHGAGGGGGYSGGGGSYGIGGNGGGGGSFNAALDALNIAQANTGNGYIVITIQPTPLCVPGCTDPLADNFDPQANFDDGSCTTSGCTDPAAANYNANATSDNGTCLYPGCTYATASNYDMNANVDDGSCIFNDCPANLGCTDPTACNFNPLADLEDGSCEYASCAACTDVNACNYNPLATVDNGTCLYADVCGNCGGTATAGCTNANACNFDPAAGCDDGSCEFDSCGGCTDPVASNYNPASTIEDGSCDYCNATVLYDVSGPDPIFIGSGISNNHMTVAESCDISASMKAMLRFVGDVVPQNNIYRIESGESPTSGGDPTPAAGIARWNYLISVNLGDHNFNEVDVILDIDFDPAVASGNTFAANYSIVMADQGLANTALVQDSQNLGFDFWQALGDPAILPFDPFANGQYDFTLRVVSSAGHELISLPMVVEVFTPGCMDAAACNYNPQASEDDGSCEIAGCTDMAACNYNVNAVCDDATCEYMSCTGCTDAAACNYNANATIDDASCEFMSCAGCTDANACNYNPDATIEDDSCDYGCIGCTYATANNYNANATIDDGSCTFGPSEISCGFGTFWDPVTETCVAFTDCPADLNGDGLVNSGDLLTFLGAFGTICE